MASSSKFDMGKLYSHPRIVKAHVEAFLEKNNRFLIEVKSFAGSKNGQRMKRMLVCLQGNLPLSYNNGKSVYHIPVVIRILEHYPEQPPVVYLRKTPGMNFWLPKHLDADGKVKVPYLTNWHVYNLRICLLSASNLRHLFKNMVSVFSSQLVAKKKAVAEAYQCLFLHSGASDEKLHSAIRELSRISHPDKGGSHEQFLKFSAYAAIIKEARLVPDW